MSLPEGDIKIIFGVLQGNRSFMILQRGGKVIGCMPLPACKKTLTPVEKSRVIDRSGHDLLSHFGL